MNVQEEERLED